MFYSSLNKLINRRVCIKKVSFFIFCIAGALSAFHPAAIKHPSEPGSLFSFRRPEQTVPCLLQMWPPFALCQPCCGKKDWVSFTLRTKPAPVGAHVQRGAVFGIQPSRGRQRPRSPPLSTLSWAFSLLSLAGGWHPTPAGCRQAAGCVLVALFC